MPKDKEEESEEDECSSPQTVEDFALVNWGTVSTAIEGALRVQNSTGHIYTLGIAGGVMMYFGLICLHHLIMHAAVQCEMQLLAICNLTNY